MAQARARANRHWQDPILCRPARSGPREAASRAHCSALPLAWAGGCSNPDRARYLFRRWRDLGKKQEVKRRDSGETPMRGPAGPSWQACARAMTGEQADIKFLLWPRELSESLDGFGLIVASGRARVCQVSLRAFVPPARALACSLTLKSDLGQLDMISARFWAERGSGPTISHGPKLVLSLSCRIQ